MAFPEWVQAQPSKLDAMVTLFEALIEEGELECDHCSSPDVASVVVSGGGAVPICENCC